jgi:hypothetical protein
MTVLETESIPTSLVRFLNEFPFTVEAGAVEPCKGSSTEPSPTPSAPAPRDLVAGPLADMTARSATASVMRGGVMNKSVANKAVLNKNKNKNKNKIASGISGGNHSQLIPSFEIRRLHQRPANNAFYAAQRFTWELLDIPPPPGPDYSRLETEVLLSMQARAGERNRRQPDIEREDTLDVSEFMRPLRIEGIAGYEATEGLFYSILTACEYVGLIYKDKYNRMRPSQFEPRLRPLLAVPAHEAYPSNHSFQCFSIVFAFNTILPEHPVTDELARVAQCVAENREWAGLHYPSDTEAGRELARRFSPYLRDAFHAAYLAVQQEWH